MSARTETRDLRERIRRVATKPRDAGTTTSMRPRSSAALPAPRTAGLPRGRSSRVSRQVPADGILVIVPARKSERAIATNRTSEQLPAKATTTGLSNGSRPPLRRSRLTTLLRAAWHELTSIPGRGWRRLKAIGHREAHQPKWSWIGG